MITRDHGTNFVSDNRDFNELYSYLRDNESKLAQFCTSQRIKWNYIPERYPNFGGLRESAVKSTKNCLRKVANTIRMAMKRFRQCFHQKETKGDCEDNFKRRKKNITTCPACCALLLRRHEFPTRFCSKALQQ